MAEIEDKQQREELEQLFNPPPPMKLIYRILMCGTVGVFLAVVTVRTIAPNAVPHITFTHQSTNEP